MVNIFWDYTQDGPSLKELSLAKLNRLNLWCTLQSLSMYSKITKKSLYIFTCKSNDAWYVIKLSAKGAEREANAKQGFTLNNRLWNLLRIILDNRLESMIKRATALKICILLLMSVSNTGTLHCILLKIKNYKDHPPYIHHGGPCNDVSQIIN